MKIAILLLLSTIYLTICHEEVLTFLDGANLKALDGNSIKVYSMVWSAKYYNPGEKKTFFYAIPFSFATTINVDTVSKKIHFDYNRCASFSDMYKVLKQEGKAAEESSWNRIISYSDNYSKSDLNLDFVSNPDFSLTNVKVYQNQFAKSVQIKISQPKSKSVRSFYITFDFAKGEVAADDIEAFINFVNSLQPKQ